MIEYLELRNFRIHEKETFLFENKDVFLEGLNGSGKTSVLEAIYYVSALKSFRTTDDESLLTTNKPYSKIVLKTNKGLYEVVIYKGKKTLKINNKPIKKMSEFIAEFKTVLFSPEDLNLIYGPPIGRRSFMDLVMVQINKDYLENLSVYKKVLKERNLLLKQLKEDSDLTFLKIINKRLASEADEIIEKRTNFIKKLNKAFKTRFKSFNEKDDVELIYQPNCLLNTLESVLKEKFKRDLLTETTTAGPHRDELLINFQKRSAREYASSGENRLIAISLKLALIDLFDNKEEIVVMLDDVLGELDENNAEKLQKMLNLQQQVIMTGTNNKYPNIQTIKIDKKGESIDE